MELLSTNSESVVVHAILDTGAECSLIRDKLRDRLGLPLIPHSSSLTDFTGTVRDVVCGLTPVRIRLRDGNNHPYLSMYLRTLPSLAGDLILGRDFLVLNDCHISLRSGKDIEGVNTATTLPLYYVSACDPYATTVESNREVTGELLSKDDEELPSLVAPNLEPLRLEDVDINPDLPLTDREKLLYILNQYPEVVKPTVLPACNVTKHEIKLLNKQPTRIQPYRLSAKKLAVVREEVDKMLEKGIIRPSTSPWSSPVVLVPKPDNSWRFCVDYRAVNSKTIRPAYPMPYVDDALDKLAGYKYYFNLDLITGYWQLLMEEESIPVTAFLRPDGLFEFVRMPLVIC